MIRKYRIGVMTYLFEVGFKTYGKSCSAFGLTDMQQRQYIPVVGSIAMYETGKITSLRVCSLDLYFPADDYEFPDKYELVAYEKLPLV